MSVCFLRRPSNMVLPRMAIVSRLFVGVVCLACLVSAEVNDRHSSAKSVSKTSSKRGVSGSLAGVPGVLYSQYSPHVQPVPVPQPFPVPIPHPVPVQVPRPFPVTVHKPVGIPVPVGVPVPIHVPVPRPYPVPVPVNIPGGPSAFNAYGGSFGAFSGNSGGPYQGGHYSGLSGHPFSAGYFSGGPHSGSPLGSYTGGHSAPSGPSALGRLGYGLGVYSPGSPPVPVAHPGLEAASLSPHSSAFAGSGPLGLPGASPLADPLSLALHASKH